MIPVQLTLRNFLSYREDAELDLTGIHLACISGPNGAGKSTLLDAITWALFGKSRVKSDDDIVNRHSAAHAAAAEVSFVFELEGAVYRVVRRKGAGKTTELEFNARVPGLEGDRWQVRTEAKLRDTQAEIEKLLRMNYDVFTNASFLLQGKADEFTTKTADRRKEILAEILGVSQWDAYKDMATERRKEADGEAAAIDRQIAEVEAELTQEDEMTRALEVAESRARVVTAERDRHEALVATARQNQSLADQQRQLLKRFTVELADIDSELERIGSSAAQRSAELSGHHALLDRREAIQSAYVTWQQVEAEFKTWQAKADENARIAQEMHPLEMAIARAETQLEQRIRELEAQEEAATKAAVDLETLQANLAEQETRLAQIQVRAAELAHEESAWQTAQASLQQLEFQRTILEQQLVQLRSRFSEILSWENEREQIGISLRVESDNLNAAESELEELVVQQQQLIDNNTELAKREAENDHLKVLMNEIVDRLAQLESEDGQECPVCGQPLSADHRHRVIQESQTRGKELGDQHRRNTAAMATIQRASDSLVKVLQQQQVWEKKRTTHQAAVARHESRLYEIDKSLAAWRADNEPTRLAELETKLADGSERDSLLSIVEQFKTTAAETRQLQQEEKTVENLITRYLTQIETLQRLGSEWQSQGIPALAAARLQLAENAFALDERASLEEIKVRSAAVEYNADAHTTARSRLADLSTASQEHQQLLQAEAAVKPLSDSLIELDRQRERLLARVADLGTQREQAQNLLQTLEAGVGDLQSAESELHRLREEVVAANRAVGGARQRVEVLAIRRNDRKQLGEKKTSIAHRISLLRQLEEACGRKGVQALLIDSALPEIESYANDLLFRLSGGDMHISFDTQRASKSKQESYIETLDIKISDGAGERPYENYSGGEKFRVNFAIRLALSQVLARRAGARLRTLVIDEGFGSQDPEGRQRLVEAINAVQDEFACILVITHIDELRDKFPARIDVEKTSTGSHFSVVTI